MPSKTKKESKKLAVRYTPRDAVNLRSWPVSNVINVGEYPAISQLPNTTGGFSVAAPSNVAVLGNFNSPNTAPAAVNATANDNVQNIQDEPMDTTPAPSSAASNNK